MATTANRWRAPQLPPTHARPCLLVSLRWTSCVNALSVVLLAAALIIGLAAGGAGHDAASAAEVNAAELQPARLVGNAGAPAAVELPGPAPRGDGGPRPSSDPTAVARGVTASALARDGIPSVALTAYQDAAARERGRAPSCGIDWSLIAAIGRVESDHGQFAGALLGVDGTSTPKIVGIALDGQGTALIRDTDNGRLDRDTVYDHAVGPMQFIPSTWRSYGVDGNGDGRADPFNVFDAAAAAADYLCAAGGELTTAAGQARAVLSYNHSSAYVATVLQLQRAYAGAGAGVRGPGPAAATPAARPSLAPVDPGPPAALGSPSRSPAPQPSGRAQPAPSGMPTACASPSPTMSPAPPSSEPATASPSSEPAAATAASPAPPSSEPAAATAASPASPSSEPAAATAASPAPPAPRASPSPAPATTGTGPAGPPLTGTPELSTCTPAPDAQQ
jgi:hypothetical protein